MFLNIANSSGSKSGYPFKVQVSNCTQTAYPYCWDSNSYNCFANETCKGGVIGTYDTMGLGKGGVYIVNPKQATFTLFLDAVGLVPSRYSDPSASFYPKDIELFYSEV